MNACLVSFELPPLGGGEGTYTSNLAKGLVDIGNKVVLLAPQEVTSNCSLVSNQYLTIIGIPFVKKYLVRVSSFMSNVIRLLPRIIEQYHIDIVHFTFDYPSPPYLSDIKKIGRPTVCTLHHLHAVEARSMLRYSDNPISLVPVFIRQMMISFSEKRLMEQSSRVIAVSNFTSDSAIHFAKIDLKKISVVPNCITVTPLEDNDWLSNQMVESFYKHYNLPPKAEIVLYVGRIEKSKGIEFLIRGFSKVHERFRNSHLVIVGSGSPGYIDRLKREANKVGVSDSLTFAGRIEQDMLSNAYRACSVFVSPSLMEGFGLTVLEAMSFAKPVVATRVGAIPEIVEDQRTGLLVQPADPNELAESIQKLLDNAGLRSMMGKAGRASVESSFTLDKMAIRTASVYESILT